MEASAQSLGDVARRQREKREKAEACSKPKTYSDSDLAAIRESRADSPAAEPSTTPVDGGSQPKAEKPAAPMAVFPPRIEPGTAEGQPGAKGPAEPMDREEAYWRERAAMQNQSVRGARREVARVAGSG